MPMRRATARRTLNSDWLPPNPTRLESCDDFSQFSLTTQLDSVREFPILPARQVRENKPGAYHE